MKIRVQLIFGENMTKTICDFCGEDTRGYNYKIHIVIDNVLHDKQKDACEKCTNKIKNCFKYLQLYALTK